MLKSIFMEVQARLAAVPGIRYVDENWGQLDLGQPPTQWPAVLIDYGDVPWTNTAGKQQRGDTELVLVVANMKLTNTSARAPQRQKDQAFYILEVLNDIHLKLHGWKPTDASTALIRRRTQRVIRDDGIQEFRVVYAFTFVDAFVPLVTLPETDLDKIIEPL